MSKTNEILSKLNETYPNVVGTIEMVEKNGVIAVTGEVFNLDTEFKNELRELIKESYPSAMIAMDIKEQKGLTLLSNNKSVTSNPSNAELDEVEVLFYGKLDVKDIKSTQKYKTINDNAFIPVNNAFRVLGFLAPIVLNSKLEIIDGELRLEIAKHNNVKEVLVVIIDDAGDKADYLRLAINRISEFQRWTYPEVDAYIDSVPQIQPLLEPIGFFGNKILPETFFSNTVISYAIDPFNEQQKMYSQDESLADWAKYRREQIKTANEAAKKERNKKKSAGSVSLFDLMPKAEDFQETYDVNEEVHNHQLEMRDLAGTITENYDEVRKAEIEAKGGNWQGSRRSSKQVAGERRAEFIAYINSQDISEENKLHIIDSLEDIETKEELEEIVAGIKNEE